MWEHNFIQQMKRLREARGMSQTDLAKRLRSYGLPFHQPTVQRIESGERPVRLNEAHLIAKIFDVDVQSMAATASGSTRDIRYAVDGLRSASDARADDLLGIMGDWVEAVESFSHTIALHLPATTEDPSDLTPAMRWAMAWVNKTVHAYNSLLVAWSSLEGIGNNDDRFATPNETHPDRQPESWPLYDVIITLNEWDDLFNDDEKLDSWNVKPGELYKRFPKESEEETG